MRNASALSRFVATMIATGVVLGGCGQPSNSPASGAGSSGAGSYDAGSSEAGSFEAGSADTPLTASQAGAANGDGMPVAAGSAANTRIGSTIDPAGLPGGAIYRNPANGRNEIIVKDTSNIAVLIGDSQSEPSFGWPRQGLAAAGYNVFFCGRGGTGYVASNGLTGNYIDALQRGDWKLPYGTPPLVVIEGGGNDAARGASNAQIVANAERLIASIQQRYPAARVLMVGTLARGAHYGGGRRSEVDTLLGQVADRHGLTFVSAGDWLTRYNLTGSMADGVHLNRQGHAALGAVFGQRLESMGLHYADPGMLAGLSR
ncbi:acyl-CoA thioesterase-1 [Arthrobacter sp. ov407]|uniref:SGNH/GDSL hydrolase family protein n=1 Tax=Arthrobacter sp. ov407 TaxID=1761748 RepID=UPI0008802786|nr:SGNH/GDSL hydrolase family protein [Arthrobacter sp. ov407]SDK55683.1 acyl-CoA thioesterase-1 [Arthrobacter sp. ov407]